MSVFAKAELRSNVSSRAYILRKGVVHEESTFSSGCCGSPGPDGGSGAVSRGSPILARGRRILPGRRRRAYCGGGDRPGGGERIWRRDRARVIWRGCAPGIRE